MTDAKTALLAVFKGEIGLIWMLLEVLVAEREGFEPPEGHPSTVFKTAAFDHSATSPRYEKRILQISLAKNNP